VQKPLPTNQTFSENMRRKFVAFDDLDLKSWLLKLIADPSPSFLGALAEAVLTASPEDYALVRPCLIRLKEKCRREAKRSHVQHNTKPALTDQSRESPKRVAAELTG